ncbi:MAG: hypothetical protein B7Y90_12960 [Alphaproteobacteria bacterium 32-64-14]|nr:MAG: hypothetical protein B7Y90_12960 [Alphaproteobacteria bacterium 32-64-14]
MYRGTENERGGAACHCAYTDRAEEQIEGGGAGPSDRVEKASEAEGDGYGNDCADDGGEDQSDDGAD